MKVIKRFFLKGLSLLFIPVVLVMRMIRPILFIRVGSLISNRIGHFAVNTELYLCDKDIHNEEKTYDIFYHRKPICNRQLKKMWERVLIISPLAFFIEKANKIIPGGEEYLINLPTDTFRHQIFSQIPQHIDFTQEEETEGWKGLSKMGIKKTDKIACFFSRDSAYLQKRMPDMDWSYHDYRDSSIFNYLEAAEKLTMLGYFALRMGALVAEKLNVDNPKIIDYASTYRSDFLDIFISAKCEFFIGNSAGLCNLQKIFRRPIAFTDHTTLNLDNFLSLGEGSFFIPKKLWLIKDKRFMTFREIVRYGISEFGTKEEYDKFGIEIMDNSPKEIKDLAVEMDSKLKGTWEASIEDEELQSQFKQIFCPKEKIAQFNLRLGKEFLRENRELLL